MAAHYSKRKAEPVSNQLPVTSCQSSVASIQSSVAGRQLPTADWPLADWL